MYEEKGENEEGSRAKRETEGTEGKENLLLFKDTIGNLY